MFQQTLKLRVSHTPIKPKGLQIYLLCLNSVTTALCDQLWNRYDKVIAPPKGSSREMLI